MLVSMEVAAEKKQSFVFGNGSPESDLSADELRAIVEESLTEIAPKSKVLAIVPDKTRDDNTDLLFPFAAEILAGRKVERFDALVAQGTHAPMNSAEKRAKLGIGDGLSVPNLGKVFDHHWSDPNELTEIGELSAEKVSELTGGLFEKAIPLTLNKLLAPENYDYVLIFGATVPHEVAGFAGGAKYFFPGISGAELTNATHWLGALAGIENIIGRVETPTRNLIEAAADFVSAKIICLTSVVTRTAEDRLQTHALFAGDFRQSLRSAAEISREVHIKYVNKKFRRVVALLDEHYDELWTGGKASYKLGGIIADGGELLIYAPHLRCISDTHGAAIEKFGYAPIEKVKLLVAESGELEANLCVAAHLAHVAFAGREGDETAPRYTITLASQIDEETCRRVNLGFLDYRNFRREDYETDAETLIVERAGRNLYLVKS
ncbi:MAG TPA: lactate racemase domain-containing protein [Pyrinomonadaceae bacterium]|nr:lactate racemase domain-containing protein [Pyrinomonadaceae bacterium]